MTTKETLEGEAHATRREFAFGTVGGVAALFLAGCLDAEESDPAQQLDDGLASEPIVEPEFEAEAGTCSVYPAQMEGPFYLDLDLLRSNIVDGKAGTPLQFVINVQRLSTCTPIANAAVDIWHADANGWYSGYARQGDGRNVDTRGQRFLRGTQVTDAAGRATFDSIYPGWYRGRTTHVHIKVHLTSTTGFTSQMYFPDTISSAVYRTGAYRARGQKDTSNAADRIARTGGALPPLLAVTPSGSGYVATLTITVRG